jgi:hypothetical protein
MYGSQSGSSRSAVQQALISWRFFRNVSIQYIASYNVVFSTICSCERPAKHCVLYDMKRICTRV